MSLSRPPVSSLGTIGSEVYIIEKQVDWLIVSKPSGMPVHRVGGDPKADNLIDWIQVHLGLRTVPIGRLDKGASGLSVVAVVDQAGGHVGVSPPAFEKCYLALVHGLTRKKGVIRRQLKDQRRRRMLDAVTRYRTVAHGHAVSLLAVRIETGRKHQIRRHLSGIGHPICGDKRYGAKASKSRHSGQIWLHCFTAESEAGKVFVAPLRSSWSDAFERNGWSMDGLLNRLVHRDSETS